MARGCSIPRSYLRNPEFLVRQMSMPLESVCKEGHFEKHGAPSLSPEEIANLDLDPNKWTPNQKLVAHGVLLWDSLDVLATVGNVTGKKDVLAWIFTDVDLRDKPYSFDNCCKLYGYSPERLRELIEFEIVSTLKNARAREKLSGCLMRIGEARKAFHRFGAVGLA